MARPRSLQLTLEDPPDEVTVDGPSALRVTIFNSLLETGIKREEIEGIECLSKKLWFIVFCERAERQRNIGKEITLFEKSYQLQSTDPPRVPRQQYIYVKIFGYPLDIRSDILEQCMQVYGDLIDIRDDVDSTIEIKTGVKTAKFTKLNENIPSFIYAGRYHVRTSYRGQPKTCRNCGKTGHVAKDCQAGKVCRICGEPGHNKGECPERRCFYCKGRGHEQSNCDKYREDFPGIGGNNNGINENGPPRGWGDPDWYNMLTDEVPEEQRNTAVVQEGTGNADNGRAVTAESGTREVDGGRQNTDSGRKATAENETRDADGGTGNERKVTAESGTQDAGGEMRTGDGGEKDMADGGTRDADGGKRDTRIGGTVSAENNDGEVMITDNVGTVNGQNTESNDNTNEMETQTGAADVTEGTGKIRTTEEESSDGEEAPKRLKNNAEESVKIVDTPTDTTAPETKGTDSSDDNENPENTSNKKQKRKGKRQKKRKPATMVSHANNRNPFM